jgi:two-component SAPR family response regulator
VSIASDLAEFKGILQGLQRNNYADEKALISITAIYQGGYLEENAFPWARENALQLEKEYELASFKLYDLYAKAREWDKAVNLLLQLIKQNLFLETAYEKLIIYYLEIGDKASAIKCYQDLERKLSKEFGIKPSSKVGDLLGKY